MKYTLASSIFYPVGVDILDAIRLDAGGEEWDIMNRTLAMAQDGQTAQCDWITPTRTGHRYLVAPSP